MTRPSDKKVWFVTGAGRGMGVDIANARRATTKITSNRTAPVSVPIRSTTREPNQGVNPC